MPAELPAPPDVLMPIRVDTGEQRRPAITTGPATARPAAVLVLITPGPAGTEEEAEVVLIERVDRGRHPGEISFPGGKAEGSEAPEETALREAAEEVGLDADAAGVRVVGRLETFWIPVSDYRVIPVLAVADRRPELRASPDEVASILRAPLAVFLPAAPIEIDERRVRDWTLRYGVYPVDGHRVWGATARILGQLGALLG